MKQQEDWTSRLRDRLADHEEPAPDGLWADIEAALAKRESEKATPASVVPLWGKWAAAATFAALMVGGGYMYWRAESAPASSPSAELAERQQVEPPLKGEVESHDDAERPSLAAAWLQSKPQSRPQSAPQPEALLPSDPQLLPDSGSQPEQASQAGPALPTERETQAEPEPRPLPVPEENQRILAELDHQIHQGKARSGRRLAFSLYASNGFGDQQHSNGVRMSASMLANYHYSHAMTRGEDDPVWLYNYSEHQRHYQPVSFGMTVKIPFSSVLSVSSGVVYTQLRSEFTNVTPTYVIEQKQTLHYIGIPLSMQYRLWQWHGLGVYATAGGQVDFNVKAKYVNGGAEVEIDKDRAQWSVQGALGLQYDIIPQLGIYAEPGIKYYFDNGSRVRNFFKDKPTNFNLQLGLRLNL